MATGETVAERTRTDLPANNHLLLVVCTLLECLPFLEGSSDAAVGILSELIKGPPCASSCLLAPIQIHVFTYPRPRLDASQRRYN